MAKFLTREQILAAPVPSVEIEAPEWGGTVRVSALSPRLRVELLDAIYANGREVDDYEADQALDEGKRKGFAKVSRYDQTVLTCPFTLVDDDGKRLFTLADYEAVCDLSLPMLNRIWAAMTSLDSGDSDLKKSLS